MILRSALSLLLLITINNQVLRAQDISLLTCYAGDELYSAFGHSALHVHDTVRDMDVVYNYGLFDFQTPGFLIKFMRGKLPYWVGATSYTSFLYEYNRDKRTVIEQKLNLTQDQKEDLLRSLRINMQKENREYAYDFFYDNCSTRLIDIISLHLDSIRYLGVVDTLTYRDMLKENLQAMPWSDFGIDILIGSKADIIANRVDQMFLPLYLSKYVGNAELVTQDTIQKLAAPATAIMEFAKEERMRSIRPWFTPEVFFSFLALVLLLISWPYRKSDHWPKWLRIIDRMILFILGVIGCLLVFMWIGTDHQATKLNWNLLWLSPLLLVIAIWNHKSWIKYLIYMMLVFCIISLVNVWFQFLPQFFHVAFGWIILISIMSMISLLRGHTLTR